MESGIQVMTHTLYNQLLDSLVHCINANKNDAVALKTATEASIMLIRHIMGLKSYTPFIGDRQTHETSTKFLPNV